MSNNFWGKELILDCQRGRQESITSRDLIKDFLVELVEEIKMIAHGEPWIEHFGEDDKAGFTAIQLITTSNITMHFCDSTGDFYLNLFSCKDFDDLQVIKKVQSVFGPESISRRVLYRGVNHPHYQTQS